MNSTRYTQIHLSISEIFVRYLWPFEAKDLRSVIESLLKISLLILELLVLGGGLLVLLVLGHKVVHVGFGLSELHLVHALPSVPVEESLPPEHGGELLGDPLEELLDGGGVTDEGSGHLETSGWDVTDGGLDVVGDPLHEVGGVLVLHIEHLLVDLLH